MDGVPVQEGQPCALDVSSILSASQDPQLASVSLRDPTHFIAGGIHTNPDAWEKILVGHPSADVLRDWIWNKIDVWKFGQPFKGVFKKIPYDCNFPPSRCLPNHASCRQHSDFVSREIIRRLTTGAIRIWGEVGSDDPPYLVLPLTVEPTKPRLCLDARFLNLWMRDSPFSLDKLADVPRYVYKDSFMTKCDDKSGYDHVLLQESSQTYVGLRWRGWWFVCTTLPFGWKESPFIYHTIGSAASGYFRKMGIPCSLYIDDRLHGELFTTSGPWSTPPAHRSDGFRLKAAIGIGKSVLAPTTSLEYLGLIVDSKKQAFLLPEHKIASWASLREKNSRLQESRERQNVATFSGKVYFFQLGSSSDQVIYKDDESGNWFGKGQWPSDFKFGLA